MARVVSAYTISPHDIKGGDVMLFTVKAMVVTLGDDTLGYKLYRCPYEGDRIPQGRPILNQEEVCESLFPSLCYIAGPLD